MKKISAGLWFIFCASVFGQPDLDRDQFYRLGDFARFKGIDATDIDPGPDGVGAYWDFSNTEHDPDENYLWRVMAARDSPCPEYYPHANLLVYRQTTFRGYFSYLQTRGNRVFHLGIDSYPLYAHKAGPLSRTVFRDVAYLPRLKISFGQTVTDGINGSAAFPFSAPNSPIFSYNYFDGETSLTYDGFGTIKLPDLREIENVIRLKSVRRWSQQENASLVIHYHVVEYRYFETSHSAPVFTFFESRKEVHDRQTGSVNNTTTRKGAYRFFKERLPGAPVNWGAHVTAKSGLFQSDLLIHNPSDQVKTLRLQSVASDGDRLETRDVEILANSTLRYPTGPNFGRNATSFFSQDCQNCLISMNYQAIKPGGSSAQVFQSGNLRRILDFYPGDWDQLFEGQAIVNASDRPIKITATQLDFRGKELQSVVLEEALEPRAKHLSLLNDLFTEQQDSMIRIQSDGVMSMVGLRISKDQQYLFQNDPLPMGLEPYHGRWLPHLTQADGGFQTDILITNRDSKDRRLFFQPYDSEGKALNLKALGIGANQTKRFAKSDLFPENTSHVQISGDHMCLVSLVYRADVADGSAAVVHEVSAPANDFSFYPGTWDSVHEGLALVNAGSAPATIRLLQIDENGAILNEVTLATLLAPQAKYLGLVDLLFPENDNSLIRVVSDQPIAVLSLRLSKDRRVLYSNGGIRP